MPRIAQAIMNSTVSFEVTKAPASRPAILSLGEVTSDLRHARRCCLLHAAQAPVEPQDVRPVADRPWLPPDHSIPAPGAAIGNGHGWTRRQQRRLAGRHDPSGTTAG